MITITYVGVYTNAGTNVTGDPNVNGLINLTEVCSDPSKLVWSKNDGGWLYKLDTRFKVLLIPDQKPTEEYPTQDTQWGFKDEEGYTWVIQDSSIDDPLLIFGQQVSLSHFDETEF